MPVLHSGNGVYMYNDAKAPQTKRLTV